MKFKNRRLFVVIKTVSTAFCVLMLVILAAVPVSTLFGYRLYTVESGSMVPALHVNDVAVVDIDYPFDSVEVGDIIVFNRGDVRVIHRVYERTPVSIITWGDANDGPDARVTMESNYVGKMAFVLRGLGNLLDYVRSPAGAGTMAALLTLFAVLSFFSEFVPEDSEDLSGPHGTGPGEHGEP